MRQVVISLAIALTLISIFPSCGKLPGKTKISQSEPFSAATVLNSDLGAANRRLRKLSLHLRGITPSASEYEDAKDALSKNRTGFFEAKTKEYLASPEHLGKMIDRIDELFRLKLASHLPETQFSMETDGLPKSSDAPGNEVFNAFDLLVTRMIQKNLSWDSLLTAHDYEIHNSRSGADLRFFSVIAPHLPTPESNPFGIPENKKNEDPPALLKVHFPEKDPRIAGVVTTGRFFARYTTTNLNRNRGRAAALFRIFLCDDMRAVVDSKDEDEIELLDKVFPPAGKPEGSATSQVHASAEMEKKHGSSASCMSCHYKLDPLGKAFVTSGAILSEHPAPGKLVYRKENGSLLEAKGSGLGDIAQAIVAQPEYSRCQVSHFWRWYVRGDRPPSEKTLARWVKSFDSLGRRTNDFIAYLVNQPEFYDGEAEENAGSITLTDVKGILSRCTQCHSGLSKVSIPSFVKFPISGKSSDADDNHVGWLERIASQMDLAHDGLGKTMPPKSSGWQPSPAEIGRIKAWFAEGAKDEAGTVTLDPKLGKDLVTPK